MHTQTHIYKHACLKLSKKNKHACLIKHTIYVSTSTHENFKTNE